MTSINERNAKKKPGPAGSKGCYDLKIIFLNFWKIPNYFQKNESITPPKGQTSE